MRNSGADTAIDLLHTEVARVSVAVWSMRAGMSKVDIGKALDMPYRDVDWVMREACGYRLAIRIARWPRANWPRR